MGLDPLNDMDDPLMKPKNSSKMIAKISGVDPEGRGGHAPPPA